MHPREPVLLDAAVKEGEQGALDFGAPEAVARGDHEVARLQGVLRIDRSDRGILGNLLLPLAGGVVGLQLLGGEQHLRIGVVALENGEGHLVPDDRVEAFSGERAEDGAAGDLLPPGPGLLFVHDEVLVVDAGETETKRAPADPRFPHQTGVAQRSIGDDDGLPGGSRLPTGS